MERGTKENELILRSFMKLHLDKLNNDQLNSFIQFLDEPDPKIFKWLTGGLLKH